jgi:hypothetical protein
MVGLGSELVPSLYRSVSQDELVVDRIRVPNDEPHRLARFDLDRRRNEPREPHLDLDRARLRRAAADAERRGARDRTDRERREAEACRPHDQATGRPVERRRRVAASVTVATAASIATIGSTAIGSATVSVSVDAATEKPAAMGSG